MTFEEFAAARLPALVRFAGVLTGDRALAEDVGPAHDAYLIADTNHEEEWTALSSDATTHYTRPLSAQLASAADIRAWHRDGSPTTWKGTDGFADTQGYTNGGDTASTTPGKLAESADSRGPATNPSPSAPAPFRPASWRRCRPIRPS